MVTNDNTQHESPGIEQKSEDDQLDGVIDLLSDIDVYIENGKSDVNSYEEWLDSLDE